MQARFRQGRRLVGADRRQAIEVERRHRERCADGHKRLRFAEHRDLQRRCMIGDDDIGLDEGQNRIPGIDDRA
jgi:hypothetical protein